MGAIRRLLYPTLSRALRAMGGPVTQAFHILYYESAGKTWENTRWMGVPILKNPLDLWIYQEIIFETKPDLLIECGTYKGGSALYFAHLFDLLGRGGVISIDVFDYPDKPVHPRIQYLIASSISVGAVESVRDHIRPGMSVMVSLDSHHTKEHVLQELNLYSELVTAGQYLVVEDTNVNGHPVAPGHGGGPWEAVEEFLTANSSFKLDTDREKLLLTFHPGGFLRRRT
jgi:cephalosporin hydroxylase